MASLNKACIMGNLCADPEIKDTKHGTQFAKMRIATNKKRKDGEEAQFHNVVVYDKYAVEFAKNYLNKGNNVYLEGEIQTRSWDKDGETRYTTEIVIPNFGGQLLGIKTGNGSQNNTESNASDWGDEDNDIPFEL